MAWEAVCSAVQEQLRQVQAHVSNVKQERMRQLERHHAYKLLRALILLLVLGPIFKMIPDIFLPLELEQR